MNNIPSFLQRDDFMARHSDMVDAARGEPLTKEQIEARRKVFRITPYIPASAENSLFAQICATDAKIGTTLRIRLPSDYKDDFQWRSAAFRLITRMIFNGGLLTINPMNMQFSKGRMGMCS